MKKFSIAFALFLGFPAFVFAASLSITPERPLQGEPVMMVVEGAGIPDIWSATFSLKPVSFFLYRGKPTALVAVDLGARVGEYEAKLRLKSGETLRKKITVFRREKITAPLGIPQKLGGNTKPAQDNLVTLLSKENMLLAKAKTTSLPWWGTPFTFPLAKTDVVDSYGYTRHTGSYSIPHKGVDFRAESGTDVTAINAGVVRLAREFVVYGKTVVIDHGGGVSSLSLHLSKILVRERERVAQGQTIGLSGESGYALGPHLHLSVRVGGISIDPMKFFELFD
ncbi:MAG: hypothetical protein A2849_02650 [Candidatus Taylorbacteria bacterium RIFCSPHIGHO2_01_FULL_51_15]|uniref:M23ase beta-sheet core domain-containing protein n=1 Tax=Candidatus Taylorbacteria bacterium RIFCSPHIGHO2_01_FULL_51_15 TaxID=1802304 RepID=A0A1G2MD31_9BACT|nr:MAG: hypothetical protein A2849_02650 [Candidatus Taylorbacteria bacterium RIFCSPHIGHO2_01_FULL_51_15]